MKSDNSVILQTLFDGDAIDIRRGSLFEIKPRSFSRNLDLDCIEGMLLGLAIGDSLGNTSEARFPADRMLRFGEIRDYREHPHADNRRVGLPSDDTQMAFWTLEQILETGFFDPELLAMKFASRRIFGIGRTVKEFVYNHRSGVPWQRCAPKSAGNGALMRIAPILIPHLKSADQNLWIDTALCARLTHNDSSSIASCIAFVKILWELLDMQSPPDPEWWLTTFTETLGELESHSDYSPRFGDFMGEKSSLAQFCRDKITAARSSKKSVVDACNSWGSGAFLLETVPSVIYILMQAGHDPEEAIVRAVNDTRDNDTVAAIVGAAVGALHGKSKLPANWVQNLLGRTESDDDGRVQQLIKDTKRMFEQSG